MRSLLRVALCGTAVSLSGVAPAQTPAEVFAEMDSRKRASFNGIDNYSEMKTTMGLCTLEHFEKESTDSVDGRGTVEYMRLVPISEVAERSAPDSPFSQASPADLDHAAAVLRQQGGAVDLAMQSEMQDVGLPGGLPSLLMNPPPGQPWLSPKPGDMMGNYATMLEAAAEGKRDNARLEAAAEAEAQANPLAAIAELTSIVGRETVIGRPAIHLAAEGLDYELPSEDQEFVIDTLHLWVDAEHYVPLKMQMDGVARDGREARQMRIEREDMAYRAVSGCGSMYEPQRSVMRISGILNAQEQAEMAEAQQKLAEFETQMASMPQAQRDMIMRQMGPQMELMRNMASGQGIEVVSLTVGMRCNAGPPTNEEYMQTVPGVSQAACIGFGQ